MTGQPTVVRPAEPYADIKARLAAAVEASRDEIIGLSHAIHANPEPAFEERQAAGWVADILRRRGFEVEHPAGRLETAIRATRRGGRGGMGPRIGILAEYDALPGLGHGCGHNTMAASGVGAALALASIADELPGEIVFFGCPAEERGSGKRWMIEDGLFSGIDAALLFHPCDRSHVESYPLASEDVDVVFHGLQAHAAADPWKGKNALDAMVTLFTSVGLWRQQLRPDDARVHGIIQEGGTAANIIPDRTKAWFMLRSPDQAYYEEMKARFRTLAEASRARHGHDRRDHVQRRRHVDAPKRDARGALGGQRRRLRRSRPGPGPELGQHRHGQCQLGLPDDPPGARRLSTREPPGHSILFRDAAATPRADETTLLAATLVAQTAYELFADPSLVDAAWREFRGES